MDVYVFLNEIQKLIMLDLVKKLNIVARFEGNYPKTIKEPFDHYMAKRFNITKTEAKLAIKPKHAYGCSNPNVNYKYRVKSKNQYINMAKDLSELLVKYDLGVGDVSATFDYYFSYLISLIP